MCREGETDPSIPNGPQPEILKILRARFGHESFRPHQEEIILKTLAGQNILAIFPAGYGKSLMYQLPASILPGLTVVFSPLVALMHEQQAILTRRYGVPSVGLTHVLRETNRPQFFQALHAIREGRYKVVFISPERLDDERVMRAIAQQPVSLVVLDEAHCISTWGHDFRPHYRRLLRFMAETRPRAVLALTATAPPAVEGDIVRQIAGPTEVVRVSPEIPNLRLHVFPVDGEIEKLSCLAGVVPRLGGTGIIYCGTKEECENVAEFLNGCGIESMHYHAGLEDRRCEIENGFLTNRWKIVVATCALGMGIDKRDVRFVIHYRLPSSPELYYQEIGRAGRDGRLAECILLFDPRDRGLQDFFLRLSHPQPEDYAAIYGVLDAEAPKTADAIAAASGVSRSLAEVALENLVDVELARRVKPTDTEPAIRFCAVPGRPSFKAIKPFIDARESRAEALDAMMGYGETTGCLMQYLCRYLGATDARPCGQCTNCRGYGERYEKYREPRPEAEAFLKARLPRLGACRWHEGGFALDFHGGTLVGDALSRAKYGRRDELPPWLVRDAADAILKKYRASSGHIVQALTCIPRNSDRDLVERLAEALAERLEIPCVPLLERARPTALQKEMRSREEKRRNIEGAFAVAENARPPEGTLLLIDDIYDSGWTFREAARVLRAAFPQLRIRIFAITRTHHNDDY